MNGYAKLGGAKYFKSTKLLQWNVGWKNLVTHHVGLSELESISIDDGVGVRDKWRKEDNFPLKDPVIFRMRLDSGGLWLEMMIVERENQSWESPPTVWGCALCLPGWNGGVSLRCILHWHNGIPIPSNSWLQALSFRVVVSSLQSCTTKTRLTSSIPMIIPLRI